MGKRFANILETVGNTPVVKINRLAPPNVNLYVKIEAFNPLGSVKDRLALGVIEDAERTRRAQARTDRRRSDERQHRHRARHGVRGKGLSARRHDGRDVQRRAAQADALPRREGRSHAGAPSARPGMVQKTDRARGEERLVLTRQFENEANADYPFANDGARDHRRLRGRASRLLGHRLRHRRHAQGRRARARRRSVRRRKIVVCEPADAPMLTSGTQQERNADGSPAARHPSWKPHPMQGWSPDFIPKLTGDAVDMKLSIAVHHDPGARRDAVQQASSRRRKASSSASRPARRSPVRSGGCGSTQRLDDSLHAARYRRALSQHATLRRCFRRYD